MLPEGACIVPVARQGANGADSNKRYCGDGKRLYVKCE